jgi:hypothetical protein
MLLVPLTLTSIIYLISLSSVSTYYAPNEQISVLSDSVDNNKAIFSISIDTDKQTYDQEGTIGFLKWGNNDRIKVFGYITGRVNLTIKL